MVLKTSDPIILHRIQHLLLKAVEEIHEEKQVFNKQEAADFLRVSVSTIERLAFKKNEIAYSKPGKHAVFLRTDLLKFLKKRRIPSVYDEGV